MSTAIAGRERDKGWTLTNKADYQVYFRDTETHKHMYSNYIYVKNILVNIYVSNVKYIFSKYTIYP